MSCRWAQGVTSRLLRSSYSDSGLVAVPDRPAQSTPVLAQPFNSNAEDARTLTREMSVMLANDLYAQYLADLQRRLGVEINENVLANAGSTAYRR